MQLDSEEDDFNPLALLSCANTLRKEAKLCDIVLYVKTSSGVMVGFPAHKLVLINASKYFKGLFERDSLGQNCHFSTLSDQGMLTLLEIIYGHEIGSHSSIADALYAAKFLQVESAVKLLETKLLQVDLDMNAMPPTEMNNSQSIPTELQDSQPHFSEKHVILARQPTQAVIGHVFHQPDQLSLSPKAEQNLHVSETISNEAPMISIKEEKLDVSSLDQQNQETFHPSMAGIRCHTCGALVESKDIANHIQFHTDQQGLRPLDPARPHLCPYCNKAFKLNHHLRDHVRTHTGEKPFKCSVCSKRFSRSNVMKHHVLLYHKQLPRVPMQSDLYIKK